MSLPLIALLFIAVFGSAYQVLGHFTTLLYRMPTSHTRPSGFTLAIVGDIVTYAALFGVALHASSFAGWWKWVFLSGALVHTSYLIAFLGFPEYYARMHRLEDEHLFASAEWRMRKRVALFFYSVGHVLGIIFACWLVREVYDLKAALYLPPLLLTGIGAHFAVGWPTGRLVLSRLVR